MGELLSDRVYSDPVADHTSLFYISMAIEQTGGRLKVARMHLLPTPAGAPASASVEGGSVGQMFLKRGVMWIPLGVSQLMGFTEFYEWTGDIPIQRGDVILGRGYVETDGDAVELQAIVEGASVC